jgi:hypothetical protein
LDFDFRQRRNIFLLSIASRPIAGSPQLPVQGAVDLKIRTNLFGCNTGWVSLVSARHGGRAV